MPQRPTRLGSELSADLLRTAAGDRSVHEARKTVVQKSSHLQRESWSARLSCTMADTRSEGVAQHST